MDIHQKINFRWTTKKTWILIGILFLIGISIICYFLFFRNSFSKESILFQISSLAEAKSGEEVTWAVSFKNNSEVKIRNLDLVFEYPTGVFDENKEIKKRDKKTIEKLLPGEEISKNFSGIIFGKKGEIKEAKASLVYSPEGVSAKFENNADFSAVINETSVIFLMEVPSKVNPREEFSVSFSYQSGFPFPLENLQLKVAFPEGFERTSLKLEGEEKGDEDKITFNIGSLNEGKGGTFKINGKMTGGVGDQGFFRAEFGRFDAKLYEFVALASSEKTVKIISSTLGVFRKVNGDYDYSASPGETLNYIIEFKNEGEDVYKNLSVAVKLSSDVLDFSTLEAIAGGEVEGKQITFSSENFPDLLFLGPYGEGKVGFKIKVKDYNSSFHPNNSQILEEITFGTVEKSFQTKISSKTSFTEDIYYNLPNELSEEFENTGSFPLKEEAIFTTTTAGESETTIGEGSEIDSNETTLVIVWKIENYGNKLEDLKVEGLLGENVEWLSEIYPDDADFNFDGGGKKVALNIHSFSGFLSKTYAFQVKISPKELPERIIGDVKLTGKDSWTGESFETTLSSLDSDFIR